MEKEVEQAIYNPVTQSDYIYNKSTYSNIYIYIYIAISGRLSGCEM